MRRAGSHGQSRGKGSGTSEARRRQFDRRAAAASVLVVVAAVACFVFAVQPAGHLWWSHHLLVLWLVIGAAAGRALLGYHRDAGQAGKQRNVLGVFGILAIGAAAVIPYLHSLGIGFLSDDFGIVDAVREAESPLDMLRMRPYVLFYRPLSELVWWAGVRLWGGDPVGYHLLSMALHAGSSMLVCVLAARLIGNAYAAYAAGLIFAVHPIHVEPVVWIASQPDLLAAALSLLSLLLVEGYLRAATRRSRTLCIAGALVAFALALLSKESALALPGVVAARAAMGPPAGRWRRVAVVGGSYGVMLLAFIGWRFSALGRVGGYDLRLGFWNTALPAAALRQLELFFFPIKTTFIADTGGQWLLGAVVLVMALGLLWCLAGLTRVPARRLWFYLGYLVVMSLPVWTLAAAMPNTMENSRFAYLPTVALAWLFGDVAAGRRSADQRSRLVTAGIVAAATALTVSYVMPWRLADRMTGRILADAERVVSTLPQDVTEPVIFVTGLPQTAYGAQLFRNGFAAALGERLARPVLVHVVESKGDPSGLSAKVFRLSQLFPGEYELAWREASERMEIARAGPPAAELEALERER